MKTKNEILAEIKFTLIKKHNIDVLDDALINDCVEMTLEAINYTHCSLQLKDKEDKAFKEWMKLNKVIKTENPSLYLYDNGLLTIQMVRTVYNALKPNL
tara:strand:+ start:17 stop:313 length:297 start_codon:yes stop_codon:yes gene_type:complete